MLTLQAANTALTNEQLIVMAGIFIVVGLIPAFFLSRSADKMEKELAETSERMKRR